MSEAKWDQIRRHRHSSVRDEKWPKDVFSISLEGAALLGIHKKTDKLFWDGKEVVTKRIVRLRGWEVFLATVATISTTGMFILELASKFGWWDLGLLSTG